MISIELKKAYENLDLDDKKNKLSDELLMIGELLKNIESRFGLIPNFNIKNYESGSTMNNEKFLEFIYEDVFEIEKQLILIANQLSDSNNNNY